MPLTAPSNILYRRTKNVKILTAANDAPAAGHKWLVLSAEVNHVTGTVSLLKKNIIAGAVEVDRTSIAAAEASAVYPLFNTASAVTQGQFGLWILNSTEQLAFTGGAGSYVYLTVLEWSSP